MCFCLGQARQCQFMPDQQERLLDDVKKIVMVVNIVLTVYAGIDRQ